MRIGIPSEIKTDEYRVAITPAGVGSVEMKRSPSLSPVGLRGENLRCTQNARNGCSSVRSPLGSQWPQSQTHEPSIDTRSPGSGQTNVGSDPVSRSACSRPASSPAPESLPVPSSSWYLRSGRTLTLKS